MLKRNAEFRNTLRVSPSRQSARAGQPISVREHVQVILVAAIFVSSNSSNAWVMLFGGPPSMMPLSGMPWLSKRENPRGRDKLTCKPTKLNLSTSPWEISIER